MSIDELKSRIIALNHTKNTYATKRLNDDASESDKKDLISSLIYVIAELRRCGSDMGLSDDGKINRVDVNMDEFNVLNDSVKNLKTQILFLVESSVSDIREEISKQKDTQHIKNKEETSKNESGRCNDVKRRLQEKLQTLK